MIDLIARHAPTILRDALGLAAVGAITAGAWMIYAPAGLITGGVLVLAGVILAARGAQ